MICNRDGSGSYPERTIQCCVRNGYLYVPAYNKQGIFRYWLMTPLSGHRAVQG